MNTATRLEIWGNLLIAVICFIGGVAVGAVGLLTLFAYDAIRLPWLHTINP